jgi:hypothetical protein
MKTNSSCLSNESLTELNSLRSELEELRTNSAKRAALLRDLEGGD